MRIVLQKPISNNIKKCLIVGPSWVGDMIMAQSLFIQLKKDNPELIIDVLAPQWSEPLLAVMPEVNASIVMPLGHGEIGLGKRYALGKSLRKNAYDWAIVLPNSLKSALVPFWAKIPTRTGYKGEMRYGFLNDIRYLDKTILTMTVQRFVALGHHPHPKQAPNYPQPYLKLPAVTLKKTRTTFFLTTDKPLIVLCPGAEYGSAKRWPEKHHAQLAEKMLDNDYQVVLVGSDKDKAVAKNILKLSHADSITDLTGKTSLNEVIALLQSATVVVSNDSGLMHIAAAVNTPLVALYGSSDPHFTPPLNKQVQIVTLDMACSPCFKRECPLGHLKCLEDISADFVEHKIKELIVST